MWTAVHLPCFARPTAEDVEAHDVLNAQQRRPNDTSAPSLRLPVMPKVSLGNIRERSSNTVSALSRYHHRDVSKDYKVSANKVLGTGCSGKVVLATSLAGGRKCALKRIKKNSVAPKVLQQLINEVEICLTLDHPNVVRLNDVYDTNQEIALLTEVLDGGELFGRLAEVKIFPEPLAAETTRQMLRALGYLHSHDIVHRDIKLENIMYESDAVDSPLKFIDFGFAKVWDSSKLMQASCGSVAYVSPDVLRGQGYTSKCDLWSLGVIVFMLLSGYPPFHGSDDKMKMKIVAADVDWNHPRRWAKVSESAMDFVRGLLVQSPASRLDTQAALNHPWLTSTALTNSRPVLSAAQLRSIDSYAGAPLFRRAILQLVARELAPDDVSDLRRTFLEMAGDEEGTVRLSELKAAIRGDASTQPVDSDPKTPARQLRRAKTEQLHELFHVMDVNGDEQVYYSDFLAATMNEEQKFGEVNLHSAFRRLDADGSGGISAADICSTMGDTLEWLETQDLIRDAGLSPSSQCEISFESFVRVLEGRPIVYSRVC